MAKRGEVELDAVQDRGRQRRCLGASWRRGLRFIHWAWIGAMGRACLGDEGKRGDGDARTWAMAQLRVSWRESRRAVRGAAWRGAGPGTTRHGRDDAGAGVGPARCDAWRDTTRCGCGAASAVRLGLGSDAAEGKEARLRCSTGVTGTAGSDVVHAVDGIERLADSE
ncbi:hypothetical protein OsJ_32716 [Oryza sativa Japonica Group]|uniref:Uncharacterized protein n=1 Tax=Oryza sativa subsp. japonica TaxID=39947 RepID=A3C7Z4_ORYSJ|nr:hypothetical protein OsJ_32716 [Oryza sativa Japonica Group]